MSRAMSPQVHEQQLAAASAWLKKASDFAAMHATEKPLFSRLMGKGRGAVSVRFTWPGVLSVYDPATGKLLAESAPGKPTGLMLTPGMFAPLAPAPSWVVSAEVHADLLARLDGLFRGLRQEVFASIYLSRELQILGVAPLFWGDLTTVTVDVARVARSAAVAGAHALIVAHNHPAGDPTPSDRDLRLTRRLRLVQSVMGIPLLDHLVWSSGGVVYLAGQPEWGTQQGEFDALLAPISVS